MKHYYSMAILFILMLLAFRLSGYTSAMLSLFGVIAASPSIQFKHERQRWLTVFLLLALCLFFYPALEGLKVGP